MTTLRESTASTPAERCSRLGIDAKPKEALDVGTYVLPSVGTITLESGPRDGRKVHDVGEYRFVGLITDSAPIDDFGMAYEIDGRGWHSGECVCDARPWKDSLVISGLWP